MKYEAMFRIAVVVLLSAILVVQILTLLRAPQATPTMADLREASGDQRGELMLRVPLVRVQGAVEVNGSVEIENDTIQVEVVR